MPTESTRSDFITRTRQQATAFINAVDELAELKRQWDRGMNTWLIDATGSDPDVEDYEANDFAGAHEGLMKADITAVFTTLAAIEDVLGQGHGTNLEKVRQS
jgi:hypothetical protein